MYYNFVDMPIEHYANHRYLTLHMNDDLTKLLDKLVVRYKVHENSFVETTDFYALGV